MFESIFGTTFERECKKLDRKYYNKILKKVDATPEYKSQLLDLQKKYNQINDYDYDIGKLEAKYHSPSMKEMDEYKLQLLDIRQKYNQIDDYNYELQKFNIIHSNYDDIEKKKNEIKLQYKYKIIDELTYNKQINDIQGKPWVAIHINNMDDDNVEDLQIEVEHNNTFIKNLVSKGYTGNSEEELVEQWLQMFYLNSLSEDTTKDYNYKDDWEDEEDSGD